MWSGTWDQTVAGCPGRPHWREGDRAPVCPNTGQVAEGSPGRLIPCLDQTRVPPVTPGYPVPWPKRSMGPLPWEAASGRRHLPQEAGPEAGLISERGFTHTEPPASVQTPRLFGTRRFSKEVSGQATLAFLQKSGQGQGTGLRCLRRKESETPPKMSVPGKRIRRAASGRKDRSAQRWGAAGN